MTMKKDVTSCEDNLLRARVARSKEYELAWSSPTIVAIRHILTSSLKEASKVRQVLVL